ncbi:unnamed protein product [Rotaria sp. Silwood2]|nr:unnamed protein product [Rotaria sp. Silwood2]
MKQIGNTRTDTKRLLDISEFSIEDNMNDAFLGSQMDRDVHLWLIDDNISNSLVYHPRSAILDFGIALSGVHQRLIQRVFIHNQSGKDLTIEINRQNTVDNTFNVTAENCSVSAGGMCEFEVLDVELSSETIDFGYVPCSARRIEEKIFLNNVLPCPVRVKARLQATEKRPHQSKLTIIDEEIDLAAESKCPFALALESCAKNEEDIEADISLVVDTRKNLKWIKVLAYVRRSHLTVLYQSRIIIDNSQSGHLLIENFYKGEKRLIPIEFYNSGPVEYTLCLTSEDKGLVFSVAELKLSASERKTVHIEVQISTNVSSQIFTINIEFLNVRRRCKLILMCETATPALDYHIPKAEEQHVIIINTKNYKKEIWNPILNVLNPVKHQVIFTNTGKAAATLRFDRVLAGENPSLLLTSCFDVKPSNTIVLPHSDVCIDLFYHPKDFRSFDGIVQFISNVSIDPVHVPYHLEFHAPIVYTSPRTVIDIGVIQLGATIQKELLTVQNIGPVELRAHFSGPFRQHSSVQSAALKYASPRSNRLVGTDGFVINSKKKRSFSVMIEFNSIGTSLLSNVVTLCGFELITQNDPVINIQGVLVERKIMICVIGHAQPLLPLVPYIESKCKPWSSLRTLSPSWLQSIYADHHVYEKYASLIVFTAIGHVCGSQRTNDELPITLDEWKTFCANLSTDNRTITLEMFRQSNNVSNSIETLSKLLGNPDTDSYHYSLFYNLASFYSSFSCDDTIGTQIFAGINSTDIMDEAYTMQCYANQFWALYTQCSVDDSHRQSIRFVYRCISEDPAISTDVRKFIEFIHDSLNAKTANDIIKQLSAIIPKDDAMSELLTIQIGLRNTVEWPLLFALVSDRVREIVIRLINEDFQALLDLNFNLIDQESSNFWKRAIMEMTKTAHNKWNVLTLNERTNCLVPFFTDYPDFVLIIVELSKQQQPQLNHLLSVTKIIFKRVDPSQDFYNIESSFQARTQHEITDKLRIFSHLWTIRSDLALSILQLRRSIINDSTDGRIRSNQIDKFCEILGQLAKLDAHQWKKVQLSIISAWSLLCTVTENETRLSDVVDRILHLLHILDIDKQWSSVRDAYKQFCSRPSWTTAQHLTDVINADHEINNLFKKISTHTDEEDMAADVFRLCRCLSTSDEQTLLDSCKADIQNPSSVKLSNIDLLKRMENFASGLMKKKIQFFLQSIQIFEQIPSNNVNFNECSLKTLVPMWQTLFDITCSHSLRTFEAVSSILISFHGLVITKEIPLIQQLYTTNMTAALCTLANCRLYNREMATSTITTPNVLSIMSIIRTSICNRDSSPSTTPMIKTTDAVTMPWDTDDSVRPSKIIVTRVSPYSNSTLEKMQVSVEGYINRGQLSTVQLKESDTVQVVVDTTFAYRLQVAQWYDAFVTFNVLVSDSSYRNQTSLTIYGCRIIEYGLRLLRDLVVIRMILEPTFTRVGVRFLLNDLVRLENCLRSLSLEKYPKLKNILCVLHVDIRRPKLDLKSPSRSLTLKGNSVRKLKFDLDAHTITTSLQISQRSMKTSLPLDVDQDNVKLSNTEWENAIQYEIRKRTNINMTSANTRYRPIHKHSQVVTSNVRSRVQRLANDILDQHTNMHNLTGIGGNIDAVGDYIGSINTFSMPEINIEQQINVMRNHLKNDIKLIDMYKIAGQKIAMITPDGKLDNRPVLKLTTKCERWTYQMLVETEPITSMIELMVKGFRSSWEQLINRSNSNDQHEIHWCIMIDNSGSMSIHRNAIYESLVVLMELLRKLENKFAVARFGGRTNQKILKNLNDMFTNQDGQYILEALTFDEGTYPATGLARVADRVFPERKIKSPTNIHIHQVVIMITDGLTNEREDTTYSGTMVKYNIDLGILFIETDMEATSKLLLDCLKTVQNVIIKSNKMVELPCIMPQLLYKMINKCLQETNSIKKETILPSIIHIEVPSYDGDTPIPNQSSSESIKYSCANPSSYMISIPIAIIPGLSHVSSVNMDP